MALSNVLAALTPPDDSRQYLTRLKKTLDEVKVLSSEDQKEALHHLVIIYLDCPSKIPAKRVIASFFQNRNEYEKVVEASICKQLSDKLEFGWTQDGWVTVARHCVDAISALMENFKLGERCLSQICPGVIKFLAQAEKYFLTQMDGDVPPVRLNEVMHHCHVTIQTINLVLQKVVVGNPKLIHQITDDVPLMSQLIELDLQIVRNELFLLDCRCCCAMNIILLLQLALPIQIAARQIPELLLPHSNTRDKITPVPWLTKSQANQLSLDNLSTLSYLAIVFGYIAMVHSTSLVEDDAGSHFYVDILLPNLLDKGIVCSDTVSKALFGKTVNLWTTKLLNSIQDTKLPKNLAVKLHGESPALQSLLGYVWTYWEDQLDVIRQSSKTVFENVVKIHCFVSSNTNQPDAFLHSLLNHLFSVSWTSRGKFSALTSCVRLVGADAVLRMRSDLPTEVLNQLQEQALSCYASELFWTLFASHQQEQLSDGEWKEDTKTQFLQTWMEPVITAMCSTNKKLKQNIIEYLLPKLLKAGDDILNFMIQRLSTTDNKDQAESCQGAIVMCLRRARALGLLRTKTNQGNDNCMWHKYLHSEGIKAALCSLDEQVRLDAFALLCENSKTAEIITDTEFKMLKFFIPSNLNNQSPAFRQAFVALLKKFFFRVKESLGAVKRQAKKDKTSMTTKMSLRSYESFLVWLSNHLLCSLYPGSAFARRTTSLAILSLMTSYFVTGKDGFSVPQIMTKCHVKTLFECLTDTFEENKKEALNILSVYIIHVGPVMDKQELIDMMKISMDLACSTRPQDCDTAVYNFLLVVKQYEYHPHICELSEVLSQVPNLSAPKPESLGMTKNPPLYLLNALLSLLDDQILVANQSLITAAANRPMYPTLHCIRYILQEFNFRTLSPELMTVAKNFLHSLINSCLDLSKVVSPVVQNSSPEGNVPEDAILGQGFDVSKIFPDDGKDDKSEEDTASKGQPSLAESVMLSRALVESMPEYLVVCGWRSIKEVSLTLGKLCLQVPALLIVETANNNSLLSLDQIKIIGDYFTRQLLESIHRGAFELAYAGFQLMCQMLWSHPCSSFHHLPSQWLTGVVTDIKSDSPNSRLCSTRRSAGVPFFVQAITSTEPSATGRKCFHETMKELLSLAVVKTESIEGQGHVTSDAQVHALNILRTLFRDARLGEDVVPYVADGLKAAILGFKSELWAVRNSATLLLSALMTRMFGVKRSKDETAMSKKNCQTGRSFFHRYPSLYPFLLSELEQATANISSKHKIHLHPSLYPVLLVLGRLFPSTLEGSDTSLSLSAFIPHVIRCASSPVYKTRIIASRALQPLAKRNQVISISQQLLDSLPESASHNVPNSLIHGSLLQLCQLMELVHGLSAGLQADVIDFTLANLEKRVWLISSTNPCYATRQTALMLTDSTLDVVFSYNKINLNNQKSVSGLKQYFLTAILQQDSSPNQLWQPLYIDYERARAKLCMKYLAEFESRFKGVKSDCLHSSCSEVAPQTGLVRSVKDVVLVFLKSPIYEVRLGVLEHLAAAMGVELTDSGDDCDSGMVNADTEIPKSAMGNDLRESEKGSSDGGSDGIGCELNGKQDFASSNVVLKDMTPDLFNGLLEMAMDTESHHECLEKLFYILAAIPSGDNLLARKENTAVWQIFSKLMDKMSKERRMEVKAAMMRFSGSLVTVLYDTSQNLPSVNQVTNLTNVQSGRSFTIKGDEGLTLVKEWTSVLKASSKTDDCPDLQLSCCHVLLDNADKLLCDPGNKLGTSVFTCWDSLATVLQEDDLEVKDIAASVLCAVKGLTPGAWHPSYALQCLPSCLMAVHDMKNLPSVLEWLVKWITYDTDLDIKESSDRLFDKGQMNTYWDLIAFSRSISATLASLFGIDLKGEYSNLLNSSEVIPLEKITTNNQISSKCLEECLNDRTFLEGLKQSVLCLSNDLNVLLENCKKTDLYLNCSLYLSVCQSVFKGRILLLLFKNYGFVNELTHSLNQLDDMVSKVCKDLNLSNVLVN